MMLEMNIDASEKFHPWLRATTTVIMKRFNLMLMTCPQLKSRRHAPGSEQHPSSGIMTSATAALNGTNDNETPLRRRAVE